MKKRGKGFSSTVLAAITVGAVGIGIVVALLAGYFLGHYTGHSNTTTITFASAEPAPSEAEAAPETTETTETEAAPQPTETEQTEAEAAPEPSEGGKSAEAGGESAAEEAALATGKGIVESTCSSCHTLSEAGASGTVGPNLDELKPSQALVETQVTNGGGVMPAFGGTFSKAEIEAVAEYVSKVAGTGNSAAG